MIENFGSLRAALPNRTNEELLSIANAEGIVDLTGEEVDSFLKSAFLRSKSASQRAMYAVTMYEWLARGSNQHVKRLHLDSPRARARAVRQVISEASAHA